MPFTLAHPAAVLPFRKYCPRWLSFPALVAGSLSPDLGYCIRSLKADEFSHRFAGSFGFCLPAGLLILGLFYGCCSLTIGVLAGCRRSNVSTVPVQVPSMSASVTNHPDESRSFSKLKLASRADVLSRRLEQLLTSLREVPLGSPLVVVISVLLGAWTHLCWDAFTNHHGWLVSHIPLLQIGVGTFARHTLRICHVLWYVFSFAGALCLCRAYQKSQLGSFPSTPLSRRLFGWLTAVLIAVLVLPIGAVHHLVHGLPGIILVAVFSALLVLTAALVMAPRLPIDSFG
jgi:hypothetical protein